MTIFGWDMSHYDAPSIGKAVAEGFVFITHKAGGDANDTEIAAWWNGVKNLDTNVLLGAYWVQYPGDPTGKADRFLSRLDATCPGWRDRPFILQVDCEKWNNDPGTVPSKADIEAFCDRLQNRMPKLKPIVYGPEWVYHENLRGLNYPLWASAYVGGSGAASKLYPGDNSSKWAAYSGQTPAILQFSASAVIGGQTTSDANAYRGTLDQLKALVAPGWKDDLPMDQATFNKLMTGWAKSADGKAAIGGAVLDAEVGNTAYPNRKYRQFVNDEWALRDHEIGDATGANANPLSPTSPLGKLLALPTTVDAIKAAVDKLAPPTGG